MKAQKEALSRYERFLPMLQLKKQQLQTELVAIRARAEEIENKRNVKLREISSWVGLLADRSVKIPIYFEEAVESQGYIAGVAIPVYEGIKTHRDEVDLFFSPSWVDDAMDESVRLMEFNAEMDVLNRQIALIENDLHATSQRVNLFEKIKIPECTENIRVIGIALGDEQTATVTRGKLAKNRDRDNVVDALPNPNSELPIVSGISS